MKQPKVYVKYLNKVLEVESINFDTKVVVVYDEDEHRYQYCDFDGVKFIYGTGFKDKNEKEDVYSIKFNNIYGFCAIKEDIRLWFAEEELEYELRETLSKTEVIGNIYENKELMEVLL